MLSILNVVKDETDEGKIETCILIYKKSAEKGFIDKTWAELVLNKLL